MLAPMARSLSIFTQVTLTSGLGTSACAGHRYSDHAGHHANHQSYQHQAFFGSLRRRYPRWILRRLESLEDDRDNLKAFGEEVVTSLCEQLIQGGVLAFTFIP